MELNQKKEIIEQVNPIELLKERPVTLLPKVSHYSKEQIEQQSPNKEIIVCDFYVDEMEKGEEKPWGYSEGKIISIDHHEPVDRMSKQISSTTFAIEFVKNNQLKFDDVVLINHTDCDSLLSSLIIRGILSPDSKFNEAAIAADHTGAANDIADLLQAIENKRDIPFSLNNLEKLLKGEPIDEEAKQLLDQRLEERVNIKKMIDEGKFNNIDGIYYTFMEENIDAGLFPALIPDAEVILIGSPMKDNPGRIRINVRLGMKAPNNFYLNKLNLPDFGGRWNAGNTARAKEGEKGGTSLSLDEYASLIQKKLEESKK